MLVRQTLPLIMSHACNGTPIEGRTRFQKMIFLLQHKINLEYEYDFIAHDYGPYSSDLQYDIDDLISEDLMLENRHTVEEGKIKYEYVITANGASTLNNILSNASLNKKFHLSDIVRFAEEIKMEINNKDLTSLLYYIYHKYPDFARYSKYEF